MALNFSPRAALTRVMAAVRARLSDPQRQMRGMPATSGVRVTHDSAEQVAAVWACMDAIASALSSSDWNVYAGVRNGANKQDLPDDALQYILNTRFNSEMTAQAGKRAMVLAATSHGNGYAEIERDMAGRMVALWPIHPRRIDPRRDLETGRLFYRCMQEFGGGWVDFQPEELFIVRGASLVGFAGDDAVARAVKSIAVAIALDQFSASYFANNAQLGTVVTFNKKLDDGHFNRLKEQIAQNHEGPKNAYRWRLLDGAGDWDIKTPGTDAEKAQLVGARHLSIEDICRWFRVPPHMIAHLLRSTNNNIEHQGLEFSRNTLRPWKVEIEQEADYKLVAYRAKKFVELDLDWAEQGDYKSRADAYSVLRACGVFSPNMVLRKLGENTIGAKGDVFTMNGAAVRLEDVGKNMLPAPGASGAPAANDEQADDEPHDESKRATQVASAKRVARAWMVQAFARIQRRQEQRARDTMRNGKQAEDLRAYVAKELDGLQAVLRDEWPEAEQHMQAIVDQVLDGLPAGDAASAVFQRMESEA